MDRRFEANTGASGEWLVGGGELGDRIRAMDWAATPLGARESWPESLRTAVGIVVASRFPMALLWGSHLVLVYNDAYRVIAGRRHPAALGRPNRDLWPEVRLVQEPVVAAVMERGETIYLEDAYLEDAHFPIDRHGHGEVASFTLCCSPVRGEGGAIGGTLVTLQDTTAQLAERERRTAEAEAVLAAVADGLVVYDAEGRILRTNAAADALLGFTARDRALPIRERLASSGAEWLDERGHRVAPEDLPALRAARHGETQRGVVLRTRGPAGERWLSVSAAPITIRGSGAGAVVSLMDVTGRQRAEEAVRESERRLRRMIDANPIGVLTRDRSGRVLYANDAYLRIIRATREELNAGRVRWDEITAPEHRPRDDEATAEADARGVSRVFEKEYVLRDGTRVPALIALASMGVPGELTAFVVDITERRRAEEALRESEQRLRAANERLLETDRRKDEFLGMLSHELRNPLAPVRNALYILEHAEASGQQARRAREIARRQLAHLTRLVDDLLDVTRIGRGKIELRRAPLDLAALARRTAEDHRALMHDRHLELDLHVPDRPVVVEGDETRLAQVLGNLLHNAAKFTSAGGRVTLAVAIEDGEAAIHVRDNGAGIAPEVLPTIFQPFTQARQTLARSEGGLGLGLALVKGLVALHRGSVTAYSGGPGAGTEFVVTLPLAVPAAPRADRQRPVRRATDEPRLRVLVIDDNRDAADSLAELVSMIGHETEVAYDAFDGLEKTAGGLWPDVVLCDIGLPGMDGYEFARQFRALCSRRPVRLIAVSGYAQPEDVARATEAGFDAHVAKPPDPEKLAALLA